MNAIVKTNPAPGFELIQVDEPSVRPGTVKVRIDRGSVCGTDVHIYNWDAWSSGRIHPPRIVGHEFCGHIVEVGEGVSDRSVGDFIASESHITCGDCLQCRHGQGHVCVNTQILGVDVDGGFARFAVIPWQNARPVPKSVPNTVACMLDALGNGVHTVMAGPVEGRTVLITGLGPIGLFAIAICRALGAAKIVGTEVSPFRIALGEQLGADAVLNPLCDDVDANLRAMFPRGVDATLEMSGVPDSFDLAERHTRPGGRISLLGVYSDSLPKVDLNQVIFKGIDVQGIVGRRIWDTWDQMSYLLDHRGLNVSPVITHEIPFSDFDEVFRILKAGEAGKVVIDFCGA